MTQPVLIAVLAALGALVTVALLASVRSARLLRASRDEVAEVRREAAHLRGRLERVEAESTARPSPDSWVITEVGAAPAPKAAPQPVDGRLFADTVLRETVVKAAGLGHGVRRALAPEVRDHIRREMRREVRRARKQRKDDLKSARRAWQAADRGRERDAA